MLNDYFALARTAEANKDFELAIRYYQEDLATQPYSGRSIFGLVIKATVKNHYTNCQKSLRFQPITRADNLAIRLLGKK